MPDQRLTVSTTVEHITGAIRILRGQRVLLDAELAALYGVTDLKPEFSPGRE